MALCHLLRSLDVQSRAASAASTRVLEKKPSRERSPHRDGLPPPSSSAFASPSLKVAPGAAADDGGFAAGQSALLLGLSSRPELVGQLVALRSFDATSHEGLSVLPALARVSKCGRSA